MSEVITPIPYACVKEEKERFFWFVWLYVSKEARWWRQGGKRGGKIRVTLEAREDLSDLFIGGWGSGAGNNAALDKVDCHSVTENSFR